MRLSFTSKDETVNETATYETANQNTERTQFVRYATAKLVYSSLFNNSNPGSTLGGGGGGGPGPPPDPDQPVSGFAQRLNGSTNERYGIAKSISVMPGDVINAQVYVKYVDPVSSNWNSALTTLMGQIAASTAGVVVDGSSYTTSTSSFPYAGLLTTTTTGAPRAYLNWLVFDRNFGFITGGFRQMGSGAKETGTDVAHEMLTLPAAITITQPGYVYIYLSNESPTLVDVFFDDFKVTHTKSPVIQAEEYYPFGLTFNSYSRENQLGNDYLYNGKEEQDELGLAWLDYGARMYQSEVGRFFTQDRFTEKYLYLTPYQYGASNPILYVDVNGDSLDLSNLSQEQRAAYDAQIEKLSQNKIFKVYYSALQSSETMYTFQAGAGKGGSGSFDESTNTVSANLESTEAIAQEFFHAFQSDLGVYTSEDRSVRETEGDLVSSTIALSVDGLAMSEDWDQGIRFNYTNDNVEYDQRVLTKEFDSDFNKAVDARIDFYKKREAQDGAKAPAGYVQKNSGVGALALKEIVRRLYSSKK